MLVSFISIEIKVNKLKIIYHIIIEKIRDLGHFNLIKINLFNQITGGGSHIPSNYTLVYTIAFCRESV
jgi:hypothetical protein